MRGSGAIGRTGAGADTGRDGDLMGEGSGDVSATAAVTGGATAVTWMVKGGDIGGFRQGPGRQRRLSLSAKRRGLSSRAQRAALSKRLGFWSGGWPRQPL